MACMMEHVVDILSMKGDPGMFVARHLNDGDPGVLVTRRLATLFFFCDPAPDKEMKSDPGVFVTRR